MGREWIAAAATTWKSYERSSVSAGRPASATSEVRQRRCGSKTCTGDKQHAETLEGCPFHGAPIIRNPTGQNIELGRKREQTGLALLAKEAA